MSTNTALDQIKARMEVGSFIPGNFEWPSTPDYPSGAKVALPCADVHGIILDGIVNDATLGPITPDRFGEMAENLTSLLADASEGEGRQVAPFTDDLREKLMTAGLKAVATSGVTRKSEAVRVAVGAVLDLLAREAS